MPPPKCLVLQMTIAVIGIGKGKIKFFDRLPRQAPKWAKRNHRCNDKSVVPAMPNIME